MKLEYVYTPKNDNREITSYTSNYARSDNDKTLGEQFTFDLVSNEEDFFMNNLACEIGGKVIFSNDVANQLRMDNTAATNELQEVFQGIITDVKRSGKCKYYYTCYDYAFYLNKSEVLIQFNDITTTDALQRLCAENGIPVGTITNIQQKVKKLYCGETISDVIRDLLKMASAESGKKYRFEVRKGKLYIEDYNDLILDVELAVVGSVDSSYSITEMKNNIMVVTNNHDVAQIYGKTKDDENIKLYGQLTKVEKIDAKEQVKATQIAKTLLDDNNKLKETHSITALGHDTIRAGRIIKLNQPLVGMVGYYKIVNCNHTYSSTHTMKLDLEGVTEKDG